MNEQFQCESSQDAALRIIRAQESLERAQKRLEKAQAAAEKASAKELKEAERNARIEGYQSMGLVVNPKSGEPEQTTENFIRLIENNEEYFKPIRLDEFSQQVYYGEDVLDDNIFVDIVYQFSRLVRWDNHQKIQDAVLYVANRNKFNVLRDYLEELRWDGKMRVPFIFSEYLGADSGSDVMNRQYQKWALIWTKNAVKRVYEPGCKFDYIPILTGPQGIGKSNFCEKLAIRPEWYCENVQIGDKDGYQQLRDSWIINMDEITSLNKKDAATAKNFITSTSDKFREAYGHFAKTYKRHCIFIGTTNEEVFLKDNSAVFERRFLVVQCHGTHDDSIERFNRLDKETVDQIWAEAVYYYKSNQIPDHLSTSDIAVYAEYQKQFKVEEESDIFIFLDNALNKEYTDFIDDSSLASQYKTPDFTGKNRTKQNIFSVGAIINLLRDNHFTSFNDFRGKVASYAKFRDKEWKYVSARPYSGDRVTKCLKRIIPMPKPEDKTPDIFK